MLTKYHHDVVILIVVGCCCFLTSSLQAAVMVDYTSGTWTVTGAEDEWTGTDGTGNFNARTDVADGDDTDPDIVTSSLASIGLFGTDFSDTGYLFEDDEGSTFSHTDRFDVNTASPPIDIVSIIFSGDVIWGGIWSATIDSANLPNNAGYIYVLNNNEDHWTVSSTSPLIAGVTELAGWTVTGDGTTDVFTFTAPVVTSSSVPEPGSFILLGLCTIGLILRQRQQKLVQSA